jgi:hypothetical protein
MNKMTFLILTFGLFSTSLFGQTTVDVVENTLRVGGLSEEVLYYGFAEGDKLIFSFEEVNGKELKELEIIELPSSSKFMDYKTKKIENKTINITRTGVYKFRLSNAAIGGRICKVKIQRIPASDATKNFNSSVYWKTVYDTSYTTEQEKYLIRADTTISNLTDHVTKVHSKNNADGNKTTFNFNLPTNTVAWSYYIGVEQAGLQAYESAVNQLSSKAGPLVSKIPNYSPLAALALGSTSYLKAIQSAEDIDYYIVDGNNVNSFSAELQFSYIKKGKVFNDFSRMLSPLKGSYHFCFENDNVITGVSVAVKITAIIVTEQFGQRPIQKRHILSQQEAYLKN